MEEETAAVAASLEEVEMVSVAHAAVEAGELAEVQVDDLIQRVDPARWD